MNKYGKLLKNTIIFGLGNISVKLVQFLIMPILTAYLTVTDYGINEILANIIDLGIPILTLGIAESLFRFSITKENISLDEKNKLHSEIFTNGIFTMLGGISIIIIVVPIIYFFVNKIYILLMIPLMIFTCIRQLISEFTRGRGKVIIYSINGIINSVSMLISATIFIIVLNWGITGYILSCIIGNFLVIIYYIIFANPFKFFNLKQLNKNKMRSMIKFSFPNVPNMFSWWLVQTSSNYILILFSGISVASLYMSASKIPALINLVSTIFLQAWSLSSSEESEKNDKNEFYTKVFRYYIFLICLFVAIIIASAPYISKFLLQGDFYEAWIYSPILILSGGLGCVAAFFGALYTAFYDTKTAMYTTFIGGGLNLLISFSLIPFIGVYGALIGNFLGYAIIVFTRIITTKKYVKINTNWFKTLITILLLLIQAILYTLNLNFVFIYSIALIIFILIINIKEIKELYISFKKLLNKIFKTNNTKNKKMKKTLFNFFTFMNKFFIKRKNKISLWGRKLVNDNIEQILSYLIKNGYNKKYKIICHFKYKKQYLNYKVKNVKIISNPLLSIFHMFTSRVIIHAIGLSKMAFKSSKKQIILDTLHGISFIDKQNNSSDTYLKNTDDLVLASSEHMKKIITAMYGFESNKFIIGGNPRNDLLYSKKEVKTLLNINNYNKIILFMPTYRQSSSNGIDCANEFPLININNINIVNEKLKNNNILMIIKPHPLQNNLPLFNLKQSNILILFNDDLKNKNVKLYELVGKSDALITDHSTIGVDYLILNKPIGYVIEDLDEYKQGRGLIMLKDDGTIVYNPDKLDFPGLNINNIEDLFLFIDNLISDNDQYIEARNKKNELCNKYTDSNNTKRILEFAQITIDK